MSRPDPSRPAPDGYAWVVEVDPAWITVEGADEKGRRCRFGGRTGPAVTRAGCRRPAVAAVSRTHGAGRAWWAYCGEHLYGRWIERGVVVHWVLREIGIRDRTD